MAAGKHRKMHDGEQTEKMIPLSTGEITSRQHVCELVFGVNTQPIVRNSVGSGHVSHRRNFYHQ